MRKKSFKRSRLSSSVESMRERTGSTDMARLLFFEFCADPIIAHRAVQRCRDRGLSRGSRRMEGGRFRFFAGFFAGVAGRAGGLIQIKAATVGRSVNILSCGNTIYIHSKLRMRYRQRRLVRRIAD